MQQVIIGVDPHKLTAMIEVVDEHEQVLGSGRFGTDQAGYRAMRTYVKGWPDRVWEVEGANGAGRALAQRLVEAGERVLDVPTGDRKTGGCSAVSTPGHASSGWTCSKVSLLTPGPRNARLSTSTM